MSERRPKLVRVRIAEGVTVYVDGEARYAGDVVELPAREATALVKAGQAERTTRGSAQGSSPA